ncbi:hypothetical protein M9458_045488, partial [Cirrhinus mrigala]
MGGINIWQDFYFLIPVLHTSDKGHQRPESSKASLYDDKEISLRLKNKLKQDYKQILIGNSQTGHQKQLNDIYTDLYVVKNETGGRVNEHEVRQIEMSHRHLTTTDTPIQCNDIFKVQDMGQQNKRVLTMGIAGVGKTVSVNKFILDWAEGKENQDIVFIFPLPFRRLNLIKEQYSLMELLCRCCFSGLKELTSLPKDDSKVMFIFDGLDECRFPLNFKEDDSFTDVNDKTTVNNIITNLIKTHLVPSALIWITSRPAAAGLIPRDYIDQVTEVRGFNDEQKEQYFKNNSSLEVAGNIIRHIRKSRSLYIMCHIPIFCWISLTVLQPLLVQKSNDKTPTTLTGMYIKFLLTQQQQMEKKYNNDSEHKAKGMSFDEIILKLGKLAFEQLPRGNLLFYKEDLEEYGLDVNEGDNGHLDLFLRFLLGLSLESNQSYLKELLPSLELKTENIKKTANYIKKKIEKENSVERTINLFHCLSELKDGFVEEIQKNLSSGNLSAQNLSSVQWSALVFVLQMSEETQEKFELQKYR